MKWVHRGFLVIAGIGMLFQDFGADNTWVRLVAIALIAIGVTGMIFNHNISSWICKIMLLPILIVYWLMQPIAGCTKAAAYAAQYLLQQEEKK